MRSGGRIVTTHILIHGQEDTVGVVVVENIETGMELTGWVMDNDETISVEARDPIPLGHKVALQDIAEGDTVIKYGHDIGRAVQSIGKGHHVHVHNTKTKRW
jgi:(2R)-sulfolactate sulfo-lyase subunit alpha